MSVIRHISAVYRNVSCVWLIHITATANSCTVGNENVLLGFFLEGGWNFNKNIVLRIIVEMKIGTYVISM